MKLVIAEFWAALAVTLVPSLTQASIYSPTQFRQSKLVKQSRHRRFNQDSNAKETSSKFDLILSIRAGSTGDSDAISDEPDDTSDEEQEQDEDYYDEYDEADSENLEAEEEQSAANVDVEIIYDEPLQPTMTLQLGASIGVMMLCRRFDLYQPKVVRFARLLFVAYMVVMQAFMAYVRIKAHLANDRTPITLSNPFTSLVKSQLDQKGGGGGGSDVVKEMASQFLLSQSTVMEYDLKQVKSLNGSLLFNLLFMWLLHFKMNQIQPLFLQTASGLTNLFFNPLFQVYVLGRNLERPFKSPNFGALQAKMEAERKAMGDPVSEKEQEVKKEEEDSDAGEDEETYADEEDDIESSDEEE